jgi:hypothetical protein
VHRLLGALSQLLTYLQSEATMPTDAQLRQLPPVNDVDLDDKSALAKLPFTFARAACDAGSLTNGSGIFIGTNAEGHDVWAHLVAFRADEVLCNSERRALVVFQSVNKLRVSACSSLAEVTTWHTGIKGSDLVERFQFVYDALLEEYECNAA